MFLKEGDMPPLDEVAYKTIVLERLMVGASMILSGHMLHSMDFDLRSDSPGFAEIGKQLCLSIHTEVICREDKREFVAVTQVPSTWWQSMREALSRVRWLKWLTKRWFKWFPVKLKELRIPFTLKRRETFPDCSKVYPKGLGPVHVVYLPETSNIFSKHYSKT